MPTATRSCPACATPLPEEAQFCFHCGAATPTDPDAPPRTAATGVVEVAKVRKALAARYRVERVVGEGGMATVYLAEDLKHHRKVALKVMRPELAATLGADRFLREIEIAGQLSHPHILPLHDSGEAEGILYYVMPYVEGESLRERLHAEGRLPVEEAVRLAGEMAEALAYAHGRGIIHRDIKPANILLSAGHALVTDFGIARAVGAGVGLTQTGLAVGTPQYMSPEQASGAKDVDARADVYAVGGVLYEMLAGEPPHTGPTPQAILAHSLTEDIRPLGARRPEVPTAVADVVAKALARNPDRRHQTAADLAAALRSALDALRGGAAARVEGPAVTQVWGLFAVGAAIALGVVWALVKRWGLPPWMLALAGVLLATGAGVLVATGRTEQRRLAGRAPTGLGRWLTWRTAGIGGGLAVALLTAVALLLIGRGPVGAGTGDGAVRLAVLPFDNLGPAEDAYFADGIADEVRGKLLALPGFAVIARSSSVQYRAGQRPPAEIGRELGADYLLTATVRWAKGTGQTSRVQVVPELIDAGTGQVRWQQSFDAALTDVFEVQASIASRVAQELDVALSAGTRARLADKPTANVAAYDAFLQGEQASQSLGTSEAVPLRQALAHYERAVALDPAFVAAWAQLSRTMCSLNSAAPTVSGVERCREAAERALALAPGRPEGHLAWGNYLRLMRKDYDGALSAFTQGLRSAPNNADLLGASATVERALGRWDAGLAHLERARRIDPRSVLTARRLAQAYAEQHRHAEALTAFDHALALAPTNLAAVQGKSTVYLRMGDLAGARSVIAEALREVDTTALVAHFAFFQEQMWVLPDDLRARVLRLGPADFDDDRGMWALKVGATYRLLGDSVRARAYGDTSRLAMEERLRTFRENAQLTELMGRALVLAGRNADAVRAGERSLALREVEMDAVNGPYYKYQVARIFIQAGEYGRALDLIEPLLGRPGGLTPGWLRIDPIFDPLRGNPRFDRLAAGS